MYMRAIAKKTKLRLFGILKYMPKSRKVIYQAFTIKSLRRAIYKKKIPKSQH